MCRNKPKTPSAQGGFLLPMAMFIIVALASLGIAISKLSSAGFSSAVQSAVVVQSLYAAESGAQYAMHRIMFNVPDKASADTNCNSLNGILVDFTVTGLSGCSSTLACALVSNAGAAASIYEIHSAGACGSSDYFAQRTVSVRAVYE